MSGKKGQVAIFILIALVIIAAVIVIMLRQDKRIAPSIDLSPTAYLKSCVEEDIKINKENIAKQGGYRDPEGILEYKGDKIKYLCYTSEYYKTCTVQQPLLKEKFEKELESAVKSKAEQCIQNLKIEYERKGYDVSLDKTESTLEIEPGKIIFNFASPMRISKAESRQNFNGFTIEINSKIYELVLIATSIVEFESGFGDSETTSYVNYYPDITINKIKLGDGSKVYEIGDVVTGESFRFASRSLAWPPGYGL
ncbi:MAG: hypothetical protein AABW65_01760 [Nanoarchaeota archaeon]